MNRFLIPLILTATAYNAVSQTINAPVPYLKTNGKYEFVGKNLKPAFPGEYDNAWRFQEDMAVVQINDKVGCINRSGKLVIPAIYEATSQYFSDGILRAKMNGKWGFIDKTGRLVVPFIYDNVLNFKGGLASVKLNDKYGMINRLGQVVIPFLYEYIQQPSEGLIGIKLNGKYGYLDTKGIVVISIEFDIAYPFSDGLGLAKRDDKWGFIDKSGKWVLPNIYEDAVKFSGGLAPVKQSGKWGFMNRQGDILVTPVYEEAWGFSENLATVKLNGKYGFVNTKGLIVIPPNYESTVEFANGLSRVSLTEGGNKIQFYIDKTGLEYKDKNITGITGNKDLANQLLIPYLKSNGAYVYTDLNLKPVINTEYEKAGLFDEKGMAEIMKNGKYGYIDNKGKEIIPPQYELLYGFVEDLAWYKMADGNCGFLDRTGKRKVQLHSDHPTYFREGLAAVCKGNLSSDRWGYINKTGNLVIPYQFASANPFYEGLACVSIVTKVNKDGYDETKYGFINNLGNILIPAKYDHALPFSEGLAGVGIYKEITDEALDNDKMEDFLKDYDWKYIDKNGNDVIHSNYSIGGWFKNGVAPVKQNNKWGFINKQGQVVLPFMYKEANWSEPGAFCVKQGNVWGVINNNGQWMIVPKYGWIYEFWNGFANVQMFDTDGNEVFFYIDKRGNEYRDKEIVLAGEVKEKKTYPSVQIGDQVWMTYNLDVDHFRNGDPIPEAQSEKEWTGANDLRKPAWCYNKDFVKIIMHAGKLYNGYTVQDPRGLAPEGWHIASDSEWAQLIKYLGGPNASTAKKLKATYSWDKYSTSYNGINESGFSAVKGGYRVFDNFFDEGSWWTSTPSSGYPKGMGGVHYDITKYDEIKKGEYGYDRGSSVRCVKDISSPIIKSQPSFKTEEKSEVVIGTQIWSVKNLNVDHFRNGDPIPEAKTAEEWLKAGNEGKPAWCYMDNNPANGEKYGKLYNWFAVNDPRGLAPEGWHISRKEEWKQLVEQLGGEGIAGKKIKTTSGWFLNEKTKIGTNESGFSAIPSGIRLGKGYIPAEDGKFSTFGTGCYLWCSTSHPRGTAYFVDISFYEDKLLISDNGNKVSGMSVRCINNVIQEIK